MALCKTTAAAAEDFITEALKKPQDMESLAITV